MVRRIEQVRRRRAAGTVTGVRAGSTIRCVFVQNERCDPRLAVREGQALRRAQRDNFFTPRTENSLYTEIELRPRGATGRPRPTELATLVSEAN